MQSGAPYLLMATILRSLTMPSSYHGYAIHQLWAILYFFIECMLNPFRRTLDACSTPSFTDHSFPRVIGGRLCPIFQNVFMNSQTWEFTREDSFWSKPGLEMCGHSGFSHLYVISLSPRGSPSRSLDFSPGGDIQREPREPQFH